MISQDLFTEKFRKMITLCSYPQNMNNPAQVETYYDALKFNDEDVLMKAFKRIVKAPPQKLTLSVIMYNVNELKPKTESTDWDGTECDLENCNMGLVSEDINGYSTLFRCIKCNSSSIKFIADHTPENVEHERNKK